MKFGTGRYGDLLARLLTGTAQLEVTADLSAEVSPVMVLESDRPEWLYISNQRLMSATNIVAAVAAQPSTVRLRNPPGSNVLAVIEAITAFSTTAAGAADVRVAIGTATVDLLTPAANCIPRDSRWGSTGLATGALRISGDNAVLAGSALERFSVLANSTYQCKLVPIILLPGSHVDVGLAGGVVNTNLSVSFGYREREVGRYERA